MQTRALLVTLLSLAGLLLAGVQLAPSVKAQTKRMLEDRAHRRLLEQQDEHYLDFAGLASHRRANMNHRGRRGHKARERLMQAEAPGLDTGTTAAAASPLESSTGAMGGSMGSAAGPLEAASPLGSLGSSAAGPAGVEDTNPADFGFGDAVTGSAAGTATAPGVASGIVPAPATASPRTGAVTGTVLGTGSAGGVFVPAG